MVKLILRRGTPDERTYALAGAMTVGRAPDCDIAVFDASLSRRHARVEVVGERAVVTDVGSSNGTFVNGVRIDHCWLTPGDTIRCGAAVFDVLSEEPPEEPEDSHAPPASMLKELPAPTSGTIADLMRTAGRRSTGAAEATAADALRRSRDRLAILLRVSELLSSPEPIDRVLDKILEMVFEILEVSRGAVLLQTADGRLEPRAVKSSIPTYGAARIWSQHIVDLVQTTGRAGLFRDARVDSRLSDLKSVVAASIRACMCVPLRPKDKTIGVLYVDNLTRSNLFAEEDLDFLTAFANQAAIAIENASLYKRIEEEAVLRNALLRFFPPATTRRLVEANGAPLGTIETEVTAVFADISNFVRMSAVMEPRRIVELLNEYFPALAGAVFRHEGTLEKYIGDALLAIWGAPYSHPEDADRAVIAAIEMQRAVAQLNAGWIRQGKPTIAIHIGIDTGVVAAGNIGTDHYIQYAAIGDATNTASRICSVATEGEICISESTRRKLRTAAIPMTQLGLVQLKGKDHPVLLHRVEWREIAP